MPLPTDRADLLRLAAETEVVIARTADAANPKLAQEHAQELFRLGEIRRRLGEAPEAERLFAESADANLALGTALGAELAAMSRIGLASMAVKDERYHEACRHVERMIDLNGGFPTLEILKQGPIRALGLWLLVLEKTENYERLYDASNIALGLIDPRESPTNRVAHSQALALRAKSADELGHAEEAVDLYEKAIAQLEEDEPAPERDRQLNHAMLRVPVLLGELDRDEEASDAITRLERLQGKHPLLKGTRAAARLWARWVE